MDVNLIPLLPAAEIALAALTVLCLDLFLGPDEKGILGGITTLGLVIAGAMALFLWDSNEGAFGDTFWSDNFSLYFTELFLIVSLLTVLFSVHYLKETGIGIHAGEYYALILFSTFGMTIMAATSDLILFFLGLETMSIAVYILTAMWRERAEASEAAMKYFIIGAFAAGFLLYGIALIFGATGTTNVAHMSASSGRPAGQPLFVAGVFLLLIGLAFKVAAVPFHFWVPDVYEGAPTPVTAFMAVSVKAAAFAGWGRIFLAQLGPMGDDWKFPLWALAILTMTLGNLLAIAQSSVKRMLAYSSIAHAGYLLIGVAAGNEAGGQALLFYLLAYAPMTLGAFGVVMALKDGEKDNEGYGSFAGLGLKRPFLGLAMSIFMFSLAGFPPLGGFTGKFYIFRSAVVAGYTDLAVIGALNSVLSVIYYLRVIVMMYMEKGGVEPKPFAAAPYLYIAIALAMAGTIYLGVLPSATLEITRSSFLSLR